MTDAWKEGVAAAILDKADESDINFMIGSLLERIEKLEKANQRLDASFPGWIEQIEQRVDNLSARFDPSFSHAPSNETSPEPLPSPLEEESSLTKGGQEGPEDGEEEFSQGDHAAALGNAVNGCSVYWRGGLGVGEWGADQGRVIEVRRFDALGPHSWTSRVLRDLLRKLKRGSDPRYILE